MTAGLKYCGGCNPRYDRVAFAKALAAACPQVALVPAFAGETYDALVVLCGCTARCADHTQIGSRAGVLVVDHQTTLGQAAEFLTKGLDA